MKHPTTKTCLAILAALLPFSATAKGVDVDNRAITVAMFQEPGSLNALTAASVGYTAEVLVHIQEGLTTYDAEQRLVGGVAESWTLTAGQMTFRLRADAKWQNGEPVLAADFVFAWQKLVDPKVASPSANLAMPIQNATEIMNGSLAPNALGVSAPSPLELVVELEHPCGWCLKLVTNPAFFPVNESFYLEQGESYGSSAATHLSNGRYRIEKWQRGKQLTISRNEAYWNRQDVNLATIRFDYIGSTPKTQMSLYRSGELALAALDRETVEDAARLGQRIRTFPTGHLIHLQFSHTSDKLANNENLRKAITLAIDKQEIVDRVVATPGTRAAESLFHDWLKVGDRPFVEARPPAPHEPNLALANRYLALAKKELGIEGRISLTVSIFDSPTEQRVAEYLQDKLRTIGIDIRVDPQTIPMLMDKWRNAASDVLIMSWPVDVDDPIDQISGLGNPEVRKQLRGFYGGDEITRLYHQTLAATETEARLDAIEQFDDFLNEHVIVFPLYEAYNAVLVDPRISGYRFQPVRGYRDYRFVTIRVP